jgi:hypothetical protein
VKKESPSVTFLPSKAKTDSQIGFKINAKIFKSSKKFLLRII